MENNDQINNYPKFEDVYVDSTFDNIILQDYNHENNLLQSLLMLILKRTNQYIKIIGKTLMKFSNKTKWICTVN